MRNDLIIFYSLAIFVTIFTSSVAINFSGKISGERTISECVDGSKLKSTDRNSKMHITTSQFARKEGYPAEEHVVQTDDGYILTLHRIPGKEDASPIFLQHGLLTSSFDWVVTGRKKALAFKLADAGYDVWMGNFRGNTYCRCHNNYTTSSYEFWDFSWHEMGIYDLPAMITYVTNTTNQKMIYIGHSMGTTSFFVMAVKRPDVAEKVKVMTALAPIAYLDHSTSPITFLATLSGQVELLIKARGTGEFLSQSSNVKSLLKYVCTLSWLQKKICTTILFFTTNYNAGLFNYTLLPEILYHVPAGTSLKVINHFWQVYNSERFQPYDYGVKKNLKLYKSSRPSQYDVSKITIPIGLIWSNSDVFTNELDVTRLYERLSNVVLNYRVPYSEFHHNDFVFATEARKYVYGKILSFIEKYK